MAILNIVDNIVDIAAGANHVIAMDNLGKLYTWGLNDKGQLLDNGTKTQTLPQRINDLEVQVISISASGNITAVVDASGKAYISSENKAFKEIPNINNAVKVACMDNSVIVLCSTGSVRKVSENLEIEMIAAANIVDISAKFNDLMLLDKNGNIYTYGNNEFGQAGIGNRSSNEGLNQINTYANKKYLTLGNGYNTNYAIDTEGFVFATGDNSYGQLGNSTYENSNIFTLVGNREFNILPEAKVMNILATETLKVDGKAFNVYEDVERTLTDYIWTTSDLEIATVEDGVINSLDMGEVYITATDKMTGAQDSVLRVIEPEASQKVKTIFVDDIEASLVGEKKYGVSIVPKTEGFATVKIETNAETDIITIDEGVTTHTGSLVQEVPLTGIDTLLELGYETALVEDLSILNYQNNFKRLYLLKILNIPVESIGELKQVLSSEKFIVPTDTIDSYLYNANISQEKQPDLEIIPSEFLSEYSASSRTYNINGILISKNKVKRNIQNLDESISSANFLTFLTTNSILSDEEFSILKSSITKHSSEKVYTKTE